MAPAAHLTQPQPARPGTIGRLLGALGIGNPARSGGVSATPPPVNRVMPPWATTAHSSSILSELEHPTQHAVIQHPNAAHYQRDAASPFADSAHAANGVRGNAQHQPAFTGAGGLAVVRRK